MIDVILGGTIASGLIYAANNYQAREPRKIDAVLRHINYRSGNLRPKLTERRRKDNAIEYVYKVPPGLIADPRIEEILTETLRKPVKVRSEEHTSELQSRGHLVCRLLLEKK